MQKNRFSHSNRFCICCFRFRTKVAFQQLLFFFFSEFISTELSRDYFPAHKHTHTLTDKKAAPGGNQGVPGEPLLFREKKNHLLLHQDPYPEMLTICHKTSSSIHLSNLDGKVTGATVKARYTTLIPLLLWKCNRSSAATWTPVQLRFTCTKSPSLSSTRWFQVSGTHLHEDHSQFPRLDLTEIGYLRRHLQYSS